MRFRVLVLERIEVHQGHLLLRGYNERKEWEGHKILDRQVVFEGPFEKVVPSTFHYSTRHLGNSVRTIVDWWLEHQGAQHIQEELFGIRAKLLQIPPDHIPSNEEERDRLSGIGTRNGCSQSVMPTID